MGSLGPTHLVALLVAVAIVAAICGFMASAVARRKKRRPRALFVVGFFCGLMTGAILRRRRRRLNALVALCTRHRQVSRRLPLGLARLLTGPAPMLRLRP